MPPKSDHLVAVEHRISIARRTRSNGHKGGVLWFTGLPGSGKTTLSLELEKHLFGAGYQVYVLDGDNLRNGLNSDLGFAPDDRAENIRRVGEIAALFADAGMIVLTAFISPYRADRRTARKAAGDGFYEIYLNASVGACEARDPKGHYELARAGKIKEFTGISAPYEVPESPDFIVDSGQESVTESVGGLIGFIERTFVMDGE